MNDSNHYTWDFDRPADEFMGRQYLTFSVGVFQWLPKATGKGLKKSKAISRVFGYTEEPERVFTKANELCSQLNRENARAESPPEWLQKQYSIPKPAGMIIERVSDDFTADQVRSMRLGVMKDLLLPAGFVLGKNATYIRRRGEQIHLVNFQSSKYGHEFTVNLGFHYSFVPPHCRLQPLPIEHFHQLDCMICERIGCLFPNRRDHWFKYGKDQKELRSNLSLCASTCLEIFDRCTKRWADPSTFLDDLTNPTASEWHPHPEPLAVACIALHLGRLKETESILQSWRDDRFPAPPPILTWLKNNLLEFQNSDGKRLGSGNLPNWIASVGIE